jgi:hypothetical protein
MKQKALGCTAKISIPLIGLSVCMISMPPGRTLIISTKVDKKDFSCQIKIRTLTNRWVDLSGLGFLPQHVKSTNLFESAMQSVDPSVSLFYWDFTIESANDISMFDR